MNMKQHITELLHKYQGYTMERQTYLDDLPAFA
jgi:hypothetical protein